uniref:precorrin-8X methylmutase n=1 Tax=Pararhizobium sp. IMCC3301 TaxID=3067904 RepID=UPI0027424368|nr:precorrin-8X methylmutase [Pararhizobium sp. IMCC3301]
MTSYQYIRDPAEIYRRSFEIIAGEVDFAALPVALHPVARRLIHTGGMVDVLDDLVFSQGAAEAGTAALAAGAPIICDVTMVVAGITKRLLPAANAVLCALDDTRTNVIAANQLTTRSAAAMEVLADRFDGAIIAIGNAPTALFRVLELVAGGAPKPAMVLGFPVGFVGAVESKLALCGNLLDLPYIALNGRRGGSAYAAAAVNALALGEKTHG